MRHRSFFIYAALLLSLVFCSFALAKEKKAPEKKKLPPYALIKGTVWDANNHPVYGVPVKIQKVGDKKPKWELMSDHNGEFAQRVPAGTADYLIFTDRKGKHRVETKVHVENEEALDVGLHLTE